MTLKSCTVCGVAKQLVEFHANRSRPDGLEHRCKVCRSAAAAKRYVENREQILARQAAYEAANKEQRKERARVKYAATAADEAARKKQWRTDNPERQAARGKVQNARRRARLADAEQDNHTADDVAALGWTECAVCGGPYEHADHVVPLARGGGNVLGNLQPLCQPCNLSKGAKLMDEWLA